MEKQRRLLDEYRFPGYRPKARIRGVFGDPQARVIELQRTQRNGLRLLWNDPLELLRQEGAADTGSFLWGCKELHKHINICSDSRGIAFSSYEQADRILTKIRAEIDAGNFDVTRYVAQELKPLRFRNWSENWLQEKEI